MSFDGRIRELRHRHQDLESALAAEMKRPIADTVRLADMKKQKLRLKDEIEALSRV